MDIQQIDRLTGEVNRYIQNIIHINRIYRQKGRQEDYINRQLKRYTKEINRYERQVERYIDRRDIKTVDRKDR